MNIDTNLLFAWIIFGAFGMWYFVYGKQNSKVIALLSGIALMIFPYFVTNIYYVVAIWLFLIVLPFIIRS
jgi:hypothetical protein